MIRLFLAATAAAIIIVVAAFMLWPGVTIAASRCSGTIGLASTYGAESGSTTANGEHFTGQSFTAASRGLPFNTKLRVTMLDPRKEMARWYGKSVIVRINDRGPYIKGRILDLAKAAAAVIGLTHSGVSKVCAERL